MPAAAPVSACRRCGRCCRLGGPALHTADLPLAGQGVFAPRHLLTLRRGEYVTDNVAGGIGPAPGELVKLAPGADGRTCLFFREPPACAIHASRPLECRLLSCDDPGPLEAAYARDRLTRAALLPAGSPLLELCAHHEAETDLPRLAATCRAALAGDRPARDEVLRLVRFDAAFRELLPARAGVAPGTLTFYLGRPLVLALPACRAVVRGSGPAGNLYKAAPSA